MPQVTRATHTTSVNTNLADNNTGDISPADHRGELADLRDSVVWRNTGTAAPAVAPELAGDLFTDTTNGKLYFSIAAGVASDFKAVQRELAEGAFVDGDKSKLDGIEASATADQTGGEMVTAIDGNLGHALWQVNWTTDQGATNINAANLPDLSGTYEAVDADILRADTTDQLTVGFTSTSNDLGTVTTGTVTPDPTDSQFQHYVNGGAHTLAPDTANCCISLQITNNASAGAITTSGFTAVDGSFTTTDGDDFMCAITVNNGFSLLTIRALQ